MVKLMNLVMVVREYNPAKDLRRVEELERLCEAGPSGSISLFADSLGDPLGRVCNFPIHTMLVAEIGGEIVGVIRAGIKEMVCGKKRSPRDHQESAIVARAAYILGLRVSPNHRRRGIALELSRSIENWCRDQGAAYAYMATEKNNTASSRLFIDKLRFRPARTPSILVHPVFQHHESIPSSIRIAKLSKDDAVSIYSSFLHTTDFFPSDIASILGNEKLCAGTFLATLKQDSHLGLLLPDQIPLKKLLQQGSFSSWAVLSVWRTNEVFKLQVCGAPWRVRALATVSRAVDRAVPWMRLSSFPNLFDKFGAQFLFGMFAQGPRGGELLSALCRNARNVARASGCQVVVAELGCDDPLLRFVPHWRSLSSMDDLWCVKDLVEVKTTKSDPDQGEDWLKAPLGSPVFVDPRDV